MYWRLSVLLVTFVMAIGAVGCGSEPSAPVAQQPVVSSATTSSPATRDSTPLTGSIAVYTSTELGSGESFAELNDVKAAGFDTVIAYGSMNGRSRASIVRYLDAAAADGISVIFSLKDILGENDGDEVNAPHHRRLFGQTTDDQVETIARMIIDHPAVKSVLIADEQPSGPSDLGEWLPRLKKRYDQIHKVKPVTVVMYWNPDSLEFYRQVKQYADELEIDYYPLPESSVYGPVAQISTIGSTLRQTAGTNGRFVLQAFGWNPEAHPEGVALGFTQASPPPTVAQMVDMAKRAVEGGAANLAFYALGDPGAASLPSMREAVTQIRQAPWWKDR